MICCEVEKLLILNRETFISGVILRSLRNYDKVKFLNDLKEVNWEVALSPYSESPNLMVDKFHEIFDDLLNTHTPIRIKKVRNQPATWITTEIKRLMEERDGA